MLLVRSVENIIVILIYNGKLCKYEVQTDFLRACSACCADVEHTVTAGGNKNQTASQSAMLAPVKTHKYCSQDYQMHVSDRKRRGKTVLGICTYALGKRLCDITL